MSRYYASIDGQASTEATRRGSTNSGISGHIRAWNVGIRVENIHDESGKVDGFNVYLTGGSNNSSSHLIASVTEEERGANIELHGRDGIIEDKINLSGW